METLVVVAEHRNQYYSRGRSHGPGRFGSFGSPPSRDLKDINCRTFQSGAGILPTPLKACTSPVTKQKFSSPKTPSPNVNPSSENTTNHLKRTVKSFSVPIPITIKFDSPKGRVSFNKDFSYSELWAGPAYSNSPPPSSLPIPKFSLRPKRTVSLELPGSASGINLHPIAKSAPPSPTRERISSPVDMFDSDDTADSATKILRRILNLDMDDE